MSKEIKLQEIKTEKQELKPPQIPFAEVIADMSDEDLIKKFDQDTEKLPNKVWEIPFTDMDIKFVVHLLNTIPFKAMQAYVLVGLRQQIGDKRQGEFELDSPGLEALWHVLVNEFEGKGIKEAKKYISVADKVAPLIRDYHNMNAKIKEMGAEIHKREQLKEKAEKPKKKTTHKKKTTKAKTEEVKTD